MSNLKRLVLRNVPAPKTVEIDLSARAVYVRFKTAKVKKTLADDRPGAVTAVDLDANNEVIGVEMVGMRGFSLKAIRRALPEQLRQIDFENAEFRPATLAST